MLEDVGGSTPQTDRGPVEIENSAETIQQVHSEQTINKGARRQSMGDHWKISELPAEATEAHELDHWRNNNSIRGDNTNGADWMNCVAPNSLHCFHR